MSTRPTLLLFFAGAVVAGCSGYEGGGDVRIVPVADAGAVPGDSGGPTPGPGPTPPRDAGSDATAPAPTSVVAYYPLDANGSDMSPAMHHFDLTVGSVSYQKGKVTNALVATGTGFAAQRTSVDEEFVFDTADFTAQAWISSQGATIGIGTRQLLVSQADGWVFFVTQQSVGFQTNDPRGGLAVAIPNTTAFRHFVVRRRSGTVTIFVDGSQVASRASWPAIGAQLPFGIQRASNSTGPGYVDDVVVWSRALEDAEIATQYGRGSNGQTPILTD